MKIDSIYDWLCEADDPELDEIADAVEGERNRRARQLFLDLSEGDTVRIKPGVLNKRYLDGAEAEVVEKRTTKITIRFPINMPNKHDPYEKYAGTRVVVPPIALEKV